MKRHESLIPLSREHHGALILARLLRADAPPYKDLPGDPADKAKYAIRFYQEELEPHFIQEEQMIPLLKGVSPGLDTLLQTMAEEHSLIREVFNRIATADNLSSHLDGLGRTMETHIRKEEREIFPLIEESCSPEILNKLQL